MSAGQRYLVFELGTLESTSRAGLFALDVDAVSQAIETEHLTVVPLAPTLTVGIINHKGRIVTVVDPAPLLGLTAQPQPLSQAIILNGQDGGPAQVGLKVARIWEIAVAESFESSDIAPGACVHSVARRNDRLVHMVDVPELQAVLGAAFTINERKIGLGADNVAG